MKFKNKPKARAGTSLSRCSTLRLGIRGRLLGAFAVVASLTLIASAVAFLSYDRINGSFRRIEQQSAPAMTGSLELARQAAEFSTIGQSLLTANDQHEVETGIANLRAMQGAMSQTLQTVAASGVDKDRIGALRGTFVHINQSADALAQSIESRLTLAAERKTSVESAQNAHLNLSEKIEPMVDDAQFNLIVGLQSLGEKGDIAAVADAAAKLADGEAATEQSLFELRADSNLLIGLLVEVSLVGETALLTPLRDRFIATAAKARKAAAALGTDKAAEATRTALDALLSRGAGKTDLFDLRQRQLDEFAEEKQIVAANKSKMTSLAADTQQLINEAQAMSAGAMASSATVIDQSRTALIALALLSVVTSIGIAWLYVGRGLLGSLGALHAVVLRIAGGDLDDVVPARVMGRRDQLGDMARAVAVFRANGLEKLLLERAAAASSRVAEDERSRNEDLRIAAAREQSDVVAALGAGLDRLADGDLTFRLPDNFVASYAKLQVDFNMSLEKLQRAMSMILDNAVGIKADSREISDAAGDLSQRTSQQSASLKEAAASLGQITSTVKLTADSAGAARKIVSRAKAEAEASSDIVRTAVNAIGRIQKSSQDIGQIIGVINDIALQTNLLALNAGVEAARAGELGKGFAVIAFEVRALAQRSATAATQINTLIATSNAHVGEGVDLVASAGAALTRIFDHVTQIDVAVSQIASGAEEQSGGLRALNDSVSGMNQTTQQNAAMVAEANASSQSLARQAENLVESVERFRVAAENSRRLRPRPQASRGERDAKRMA